MAASMPSMPMSFNSQIPVTPPPDHQMFMKGLPPQFQNPFSSHHMHTQPTPTATTTTTTSTAKKSSTASKSGSILKPDEKPLNHQLHHHLHNSTQLHRPPSSYLNLPATTSNPASRPTCPPPPTPHASVNTDPNAASSAAVDPRYIAMASRIASYYQQRCQAVANFQQQRCQQWATAQRAKCQEMTQAAMLIVAWYIRDRIQRKRRKQKRGFKRGLKKKEMQQQRERGRGTGLTKGETVRRWVLDVPIGGKTEGEGRDLPMDEEERAFDVDKVGSGGAESGNSGVRGDKDNQLFQVADNLIKSQLARIDVPMLGVLDFDESESEDESEEEEEEEEDEEMGEEEQYEEEEYDYDEDEDEDEEYDLVEEPPVGKGKGKDKEMASVSKNAQLGTTTKGSREHSGSFVS
ncbi:hypothetical protein QBC44DRAFT_109637 [Cladorrhinum sp. PSN332]|nr:hypothetical protein QBC44DRAFT_109637 [Cladorrhinum sp. PSN332]